MSRTDQIEDQSLDDINKRKAELEAALKQESRLSRRQTLLKKLWKLNQSLHESLNQASD